MIRSVAFLLLFFVAACATQAPPAPVEDLQISELHPDKRTHLTKQNLRHLAQVYDLRPFMFVRNIQVTNAPAPHMTDLLVLTTGHAESPNKLLTHWLHEELHFWVVLNKERTAAAAKELKKIYPTAPREQLPGDKVSPYTHLIVCYLEYQALAFYVGKKEARSILLHVMKKNKKLPWTYFQVLNKNFAIKQVVERHGLLPRPLN